VTGEGVPVWVGVASRRITAVLKSTRSLQITVGLVLGFFLATYFLLPKNLYEVQGESVRWIVSMVFFSVGILMVLHFPLVGLPFVIGVAPILLMLRTGGAVYGNGVELFYLVAAFAAWYKLPRRNCGRKLRIRGRLWLFLFLALCIVLAIFAGMGRSAMILPVQCASFYVVVYVISTRISLEGFRLTLYALLTGCATMLAWVASSSGFSRVLETRLGDDLGVNSNLIGQFAIYLICSILLLLMLRQDKRIGAFPLLGLLTAATVIILSGSRVALVQLGILFLVTFIRFRVIRLLTLTVSVAVVTIIFAVDRGIMGEAASIMESPVYGHLSSFAFGSREDLNDLAWQLAAESPIFGVGPGNFIRYSQARGLQNESGEGLYQHNAIAGTAAELGFVGLALFLMWFLTFLGSSAAGRSYSLFIVAFSALAMAEGVSHGLFLSFFGSLPFLMAVVVERFVYQQKLVIRACAFHPVPA